MTNKIRGEPDPAVGIVDDWIDRLTRGEHSSVPGLLREASKTDWQEIRWELSTDLKPGDILHVGKLFGVFTNEQHWKLIEEFRVSDALDHARVLNGLSSAIVYYEVFTGVERQNGPFGQHETRLRKIAKFTRKLRPLADAEPLLFEFFIGMVADVPPGEERQEHAERLAEKFRRMLAAIESEAPFVAETDEHLWLLRACPSDLARPKSAERRYIWERILRLWKDLGHNVGYTDNGPIMRVLTIIHEALGLEAPKGESVRQTISDFNGKPRSR